MTLSEVKIALRIDFSDHDELLRKLLYGCIGEAETITGVEVNEFSQDLRNLVIDEVNARYRGEDSSFAIKIRKYVKNPLL